MAYSIKTVKNCGLFMAVLAIAMPSAGAYAQWNTSGTHIYNSNTGNVGIGVTNPEAKLHVSGGNMILESASGSPTIYTGTGGGELNRYLLLGNSPTPGAQSASGLKAGGVLVSDAFGFANPEKSDLIVKGKTGIGTPTPKTKLDLGNSGGAMLVLNPGTSSGVNYTGFAHNDFITGSWLSDGLSNAFISTGYIQDARRKFHIGSASSPTFSSAAFVPHFTVTAGGNVGIGTTDPEYLIQVHGTNNPGIAIGKINTNTGGRSTLYFFAGNENARNGFSIQYNKTLTTDRLAFLDGASVEVLTLKNGGNVGIGTTNPDQKLTVKGVIHAEEVLIDLDVPGPDYVFEKDYNLLSLSDLEAYISQHKHLPEVPSAKEMETNGLQLKEMNLLLLKKVEELTLHMIQLKKDQEQKEKEMERKISDLQKQLSNR